MLDFLRNNPLLAGCLGMMGCLALVVVFVVGLTGLGLKAAFDSRQIAVFDARSAAVSAGYSFGYLSDNGALSLELMPQEPREVTCDELWALIEPHIIKDDEPLTLRSETTADGGDGALITVPLECSRVSAEPHDLEDHLPVPGPLPQ